MAVAARVNFGERAIFILTKPVEVPIIVSRNDIFMDAKQYCYAAIYGG